MRVNYGSVTSIKATRDHQVADGQHDSQHSEQIFSYAGRAAHVDSNHSAT